MLHIRSKLSLERSKLEAFIQEYEKSELLKRLIKEENYEVNREHKSI
jgi:hypothetical protein